MSTIFTKIINREIPAYIISENSKFIAFLDISPLSIGHTLVVPKKEIDHFFDLDDDFLSEILLFSKKISKAIKKITRCNRVGLSVIGLEVPHAHLHLVPLHFCPCILLFSLLKSNQLQFPKILVVLRFPLDNHHRFLGEWFLKKSVWHQKPTDHDKHHFVILVQ